MPTYRPGWNRRIPRRGLRPDRRSVGKARTPGARTRVSCLRRRTACRGAHGYLCRPDAGADGGTPAAPVADQVPAAGWPLGDRYQLAPRTRPRGRGATVAERPLPVPRPQRRATTPTWRRSSFAAAPPGPVGRQTAAPRSRTQAHSGAGRRGRVTRSERMTGSPGGLRAPRRRLPHSRVRPGWRGRRLLRGPQVGVEAEAVPPVQSGLAVRACRWRFAASS